MGENEKKEFHFINEQIKKKPFYRRKWFTQGAAAIALALIFGVAAGVMFAIVQPWASNQFGKPDEPTQIVMVQEETHTQETETGQTEQKVDDEKETAKGRKKNSKETDAIEEWQLHNLLRGGQRDTKGDREGGDGRTDGCHHGRTEGQEDRGRQGS